MPTDPKTVNWYNRNAQKYTDHLRIEKAAFHFLLEKPAMRRLVPLLKGKTVLSLACGSGDDTYYMEKNKNAARAVGVDISEKLIEIAKHSFLSCEFFVMDFENLKFKNAEFDYIYSSLALHYSNNWQKVFQEAFRVLRPGSKFLFSIEHPIFTAMERTRNKKESSKILGTRRDPTSNRRKIYGDYLNTFPVRGAIKGTVVHHRPFEVIFKEILGAGFTITNLKEPKPLPQMQKQEPGVARVFSKIPIFLIIELQKPKPRVNRK